MTISWTIMVTCCVNYWNKPVGGSLVHEIVETVLLQSWNNVDFTGYFMNHFQKVGLISWINKWLDIVSILVHETSHNFPLISWTLSKYFSYFMNVFLVYSQLFYCFMNYPHFFLDISWIFLALPDWSDERSWIYMFGSS